ncbi:DUF1937 family protein [Schlesneria sp.]|uniref:DUF1937 family protein n=1 Tax=Schlesneria sp. TaxID=2762018 RepID=UPI002F128117
MIYLASPYSHPHRIVRERRFQDASRATACLLRSGLNVFSPIVYGHPLVAHGIPTDWICWEVFGRAYIERCDSLLVLTLEGWEESVGVTAEIEIAHQLGKPVNYLTLNGDELADLLPALAALETEVVS